MAIPKVFGDILKRKTSEDANYLSLTLTCDKVFATIWVFDEDKVEVLGFAKKTYQNIDSLIHQAALVIDTAAEQAKSDVSEVVFGLSYNWFDEDQITKDTSKLLKKLSEELELDAQAFIPFSSSVKNYLKIEESVSPHAILIGVFDEYLEAHLVKNNQVENTKVFSSKPTVEKVLTTIKLLGDEKSLPSRLVIYGIAQSSKLAEDITKSDWKNIFIQEPRVDFLNDDELSKSVAYAQAADILGHEPAFATAPSTLHQQEKEQEEESPRIKPEANELGFIEGEDILQMEEKEEPKKEEKAVDETLEEEKLSLAAKKDIDLAVEDNHLPDKEIKDHEKSEHKESLIEQIVTLSWFSKILNIFKKRATSKKIAITLAILFIVAIFGTFIAGKTLTNAEVLIKVNSKTSEGEFNIDVTKGGSSNFQKQQIAGQEISGHANGSRKAVATGKKELGEYAKGEVTLLNWTTAETTFDKGQVIISKNGIKFELDNEIEIASRSASTPGKANIPVTSVDFGSEGNIAAGSDFTFQQYDELLYSATNDNAFTGGDEKQITVISQEDMDKLEESLLESLEENAITSLNEKASGNIIHPDTIVIEVVKKIFDNKLDEEASLVNLDLEIAATAISYDELTLKEMLAVNIKEDAPQNLEAKPENIEILSTNAKGGKGVLNLIGKFQAKFIPKFDEGDLKEKISGKSVKEIRQIIKEIPEVEDVTVNFTPNFFFIGSIPTNIDKIKFTIESGK